jgi:outer membrane protein assembly factor BamB
LLNRSLTRPALSGNAVVVGDFDGYVHWLDAVSGDLLARVKSGGRITNAPVAAGELLLFQTDSGNVEAWRVVPPGAG